MAKSLIFYDIPGLASPSKAWSSNPFKARLVLNMKGIPYETVWVEYPDIASLCKKINAEPTSFENDVPQYTLPILQDPNTGAVVSESFKIARYLDETYPSTIKAIPDGTEAFQEMFLAIFGEKMISPLIHTMILPTVRALTPRGAEYFRRTREKAFGRKLEEIAPEGAVWDEHWRGVLAGLSAIQSWIGAGKDGKERMFVMGDVPSFADVVLISHLVWLKIVGGVDSKAWKDLMEADGGRWKRLMERSEKWIWVDKPDVVTNPEGVIGTVYPAARVVFDWLGLDNNIGIYVRNPPENTGHCGVSAWHVMLQDIQPFVLEEFGLTPHQHGELHRYVTVPDPYGGVPVDHDGPA
ncbi:hypothetical protein EWM64_g6406 [Hericium alpestre]|uniref:GST N-terminal domain-containing protein n=1 Tax=Hericium alpestre TaxID=135208 RepID=A0A4Y9ZUA6_9AGAM|nr:hypothetical protein EWM64_g6406 [Hericium alpestre]